MPLFASGSTSNVGCEYLLKKIWTILKRIFWIMKVIEIVRSNVKYNSSKERLNTMKLKPL